MKWKTARLFKKVSASSNKSKNLTFVGHPKFQFLAIILRKNAAILFQPDAFEVKYIDFLIRWCSGKFYFLFIFSNVEILEFFFQTGSGCPTIMFIIFLNFLMVEQIFLSPRVKRSVIISNKLVYASYLTTCRTT